MAEKTSENVSMSFIRRRVDAMPEDSSSYKYYLETPLSELKTKEEKLIKKEIEKRHASLLSEQKKTNSQGMSILSEDAAASDEKEENKNGPSWKSAAIGGAVGVAAGYGIASVDWSSFFSATREFVTSIPEKIGGWFSSESSAAENPGFFQGVWSSIQEGYEAIASWFQEMFAKAGLDLGTGASMIWGCVICVLAIWAIWKLIKKFVKANGDVKKEGESLEENTDRNVGLAVILEAEMETANDKNSLTGVRAILARYADKAINELMEDPKFIKFMEKENPEVLKGLQDYQKANGALSEWSEEKYFEMMMPVLEAEAAAGATEKAEIAEESNTLLSRIAGAFNDTTESVTGKIKDIYNRISNSPNRLIVWIPPIVTTALAVLAIAYYWHRNGAGATSENVMPDDRFSLFKRSLKQMDLVTEAMAKAKYPSSPTLDNLSGKGEQLADKIIERASYVATDLLSDKDFVTFSKQNDPSLLNHVRKFQKTVSKPTKLPKNKK